MIEVTVGHARGSSEPSSRPPHLAQGTPLIIHPSSPPTLLTSLPAMSPVAVQSQPGGGDIKSYYTAKIEAAELSINRKTQNLRRLEAQRNALNARGACATSLNPEFPRRGARE